MAHAHHMLSAHHKMEMGMATDQQMATLGDSTSVGFDRQFLTDDSPPRARWTWSGPTRQARFCLRPATL